MDISTYVQHGTALARFKNVSNSEIAHWRYDMEYLIFSWLDGVHNDDIYEIKLIQYEGYGMNCRNVMKEEVYVHSTTETLPQLDLNIIPHPPCSPNFTQSK